MPSPAPAPTPAPAPSDPGGGPGAGAGLEQAGTAEPAELSGGLLGSRVRIGGDDLTLLEGLEIAAVLVAAFLISRALQRGLARTFRVRGIDDEGTLSIVQRLTHYAVMALGVLVGLGIAQIDVTTIAAAGAVFAVVVGFAMQNISVNFVSGLILMIERSIKQGDILEVDGSMVRIVSMGVRATIARTLDEEELIIPNSVMVKDTVKNYTLDDRMFRLHTRVGVSYDSDMRKVRLVLERAAREVPFRSPEHEPRVLMAEFGDSSVVWDVSIWMRNPWYQQGARSQLNEAIWFALKDAGITIAYPQLDLHVDAGTGALLRELSGRALS